MYIWSIDLTRVTRLLNEKSIIFSTNGPGTTRYTFKMRNLYQLKLSVNYESEIKTFLKFFYYYFLAVLHTSWDPSSPTRGLWHMQRKHGGLTTIPPGKSHHLIYIKKFFCFSLALQIIFLCIIGSSFIHLCRIDTNVFFLIAE